MRVAAADIGTNSTRLLVAEVEGGRLQAVERRVVVTGLGAGVDRRGRLAGGGAAATLEVLGGYAAITRACRVAAFRVVATAAVRAASQRDRFLDEAAAVLGVRPDVISGEEEALLSFEGATGALAGPGPFLVIDLGGGSSELAFGEAAPVLVCSLDIGSRRMAERFLPRHPADSAALGAAARAAEAALAAVDLPGLPGTVVGVGGTYTALAAIFLGLEKYDPGRVQGSVVPLEGLDSLVGRLAGLTLEETAALPSLDPARAPVLLGGAVVAAAVVRWSGRDRVVVSEADLLDGIALRLAHR